MHWNLPIDLQNVRTQHHHLANGYLVSDNVAILVFSAFVSEWSHEHDGTAFGVAWDLHVTVFVSDVAVLGEFVELYVLLCVVYVFYVLLDFLLVVSDVVLEGKVDESVAHGGFCKNQLKFPVGV